VQTAEEALRLAARGGWLREKAWAQHLLGRFALARGMLTEAEPHLRAALALQTEIGSALEAARTRVALTEALVAKVGRGTIPAEARELLAAAQAQFATSGATLDLAEAEQVAAAWATR
jgi:hypothetical protein